MKELKLKHREYYWEYGKSPFTEDEKIDGRTNSNFEDYSTANVDNVNGNFRGKCGVHGCKAKAMALTRFCHMHILSDSEQKLYKACSFSIKSSAAGPNLCGKPILGSTVPSYCSPHFQKVEKIMARALKNAGPNVSFTSNLTPTFHVIIAEYVHQIQTKRRAAKKTNLEIAEVKEVNNS